MYYVLMAFVAVVVVACTWIVLEARRTKEKSAPKAGKSMV